ncbi:MAG: DUF6514 family protein [Oscillospiraceae bacterium]|nr:DUF6514 family protein [Oscillospiraceae bacterium]
MELSDLWQYEVVSHEHSMSPSDKNITMYGLCVKNTDVVAYDISTDKGFVEKYAEMFNQFQLSPIHLSEVLDDILVLNGIKKVDAFQE